MTFYEIVSPNHKPASERKCQPCVHSGKGLPVVRYFWVNCKEQLLLLASDRAYRQAEV